MTTGDHVQASDTDAGPDAFVRMWNAGRELGEIAEAFAISKTAVVTRASKLRRTGVDLARRSPRAETQDCRMRRCLGCGRSFMSAHVGNRLCWSCCDDEAMGGLI